MFKFIKKILRIFNIEIFNIKKINYIYKRLKYLCYEQND